MGKKNKPYSLSATKKTVESLNEREHRLAAREKFMAGAGMLDNKPIYPIDTEDELKKSSSALDTDIRFRLNSELKARFEILCEQEGFGVSIALRRLIKDALDRQSVVSSR